jgi:hypothetical protein
MSYVQVKQVQLSEERHLVPEPDLGTILLIRFGRNLPIKLYIQGQI